MSDDDGSSTNITILPQKGKSKNGAPVQNGQERKPTRGFIRAQRKRERLREIVPDDTLIVDMDWAQKRHCVWMSNVLKEPMDGLRIENKPMGMDALIKQAKGVQRKHRLEKIIFAMEPTGHYWMSVATYFQHHTYHMFWCDP